MLSATLTNATEEQIRIFEEEGWTYVGTTDNPEVEGGWIAHFQKPCATEEAA